MYRTAAGRYSSHASGEFAFAGPDAPELYFLAQRKNPTRSLFDFLDTSNSARGEKLLRELRERNVTAVAINREPDFSQPLGPAIIQRLSVLYPQHSRVGKFDIRWRSPD